MRSVSYFMRSIRYYMRSVTELPRNDNCHMSETSRARMLSYGGLRACPPRKISELEPSEIAQINV